MLFDARPEDGRGSGRLPRVARRAGRRDPDLRGRGDQRRRPGALRAVLPRLHAQAVGHGPVASSTRGDVARPDADQHRRPLFHRHVPGDAAGRLHARCSRTCSTTADRRGDRRRLPRRAGPSVEIADHIIFTGPIDEYFDFRFGKLPYRCLKFRHETLDQERFQPVGGGQLSGPGRALHADQRVQAPDRPGASEDDASPTNIRPPRAIPTIRSRGRRTRRCSSSYEALPLQTRGVTFVGRLATYRYYNMDQVVGQALATFRRMDEKRGRAAAAADRQSAACATCHSSAAPLELWGGHECTVNRVGDEFRNQIVDTGHAAPHQRPRRDRRARLQGRALSGAVGDGRARPARRARLGLDDERLERIRELGMRPIAGLVHHGRGPRYTSLLDPSFPRPARRLRRAVAERYPWIEPRRRSTSR